MKTIITLTNVVIIAASVFLLVVAAVSINKGKKTEHVDYKIVWQIQR